MHHPSPRIFFCVHVEKRPLSFYVIWDVIQGVNCLSWLILTIVHCLLDQGIPFCTLLPLACSPQQVTITNPYIPRTYRLVSYTFTKADFDMAMMACWSVLASPWGWTALLRGGIVGCIANKYLSKDGVLDGPSLKVTAQQVGYIAPSSNDNTRFCDDQLTDNEITIICGTYSLYTGEFLFIIYFFFC